MFWDLASPYKNARGNIGKLTASYFFNVLGPRWRLKVIYKNRPIGPLVTFGGPGAWKLPGNFRETSGPGIETFAGAFGESLLAKPKPT